MIKKIWFVRNPVRLLGQLCIILGAFSFAYAALSGMGLADGSFSHYLNEYVFLLFYPSVGILVAVVLFLLLRQMKDTLIRMLLLDLNCMLALCFFFLAVDAVSRAKEIESFGLFPIVLVLLGGVCFAIVWPLYQKKHPKKET